MILQSLPRTLSDTYAEILLSIDKMYHPAARKTLMWLAFSERPLTERELEEAITIDPQKELAVVLDDRAPAGSCAAILGSLVTVVQEAHAWSLTVSAGDSTQVRLAHLSVKEFLISEAILASDAAPFAPDEGFVTASWRKALPLISFTSLPLWTLH